MTRKKNWTAAEMSKASELWKMGWKAEAIAASIGRSVGSVRNQAERDRLKFPRRRRSKLELGEMGATTMHIKVPGRIHQMIHDQANKAGRSLVMVIMDALEIAHYYGFELPDEVVERRRREALAERRRIMRKASEAERRRQKRRKGFLVPYAGADDE